MSYILYSLFLNFCIWAKGFDPSDPYVQRGEKPPKWALIVSYARTKYVLYCLIFTATLLVIGISSITVAIGLTIIAAYILGDLLHEKRKIFVCGTGKSKALYTESTTFADFPAKWLFGKPSETWGLTRSRNYATLYGSISGLIFTAPTLILAYIAPIFAPLWLTGLFYGISYRLTSILSEPWQEPVGRTIWGFFYAVTITSLIYLWQNPPLS